MSTDNNEARNTWLELLAQRRIANFGHTVRTDRGAEKVYTIMATERDLDELAELLEREGQVICSPK